MLNVKNWKTVNQKEGNKSHYNLQTQRYSFGIYSPVFFSLFLSKFTMRYISDKRTANQNIFIKNSYNSIKTNNLTF